MGGEHTVHMENGPIGKTLLAFALPVLLCQLLQEVYNVTDCAVVGRFGGDYALAAAGVGGLVLSVCINFFIGFSSGVSVVTSRLFGQRDYGELKQTMASVFRLVVFSGAVMTALGVPLARWALALLRTPEAVLPHAAAYLRVCFAGIAAQLIYNVGTAVLRSLGDTKTPLVLSAASTVCNLALDLLFVAGLRWGVAGAAAATAVSQWLLAVAILRRLGALDPTYSLGLTGPGLGLRRLGAILKCGVPAGMQAVFMSVSSLLIQVQIDSFGPAAIAGMNLYAKLEGVLYLPTFAFGIALTGFVGQNLGAGRLDRVRESVRLSRRMMIALVLPAGLALSAACPILLRLFTDDGEILSRAVEAVRFNLPFYAVYAVNQVYLGAIKGLGNTAYPMICTLVCYSLFRVLWCRLLIPVFDSMRVVYLSYDVSFFLLLAMLLPVYAAMQRRLERAGALPRAA